MCDNYLLRQMLGQALTTLAFGLICLLLSALVLAQAPPRRDVPARQPAAELARFGG